MSDSKHTPGPWHYSGVDALPRVRVNREHSGTTGFLIADCNNSHLGGEAVANAKLIAAAPELLEALKGMIHVVRKLPNIDAYPLWEEVETACNAAQSSVAKAKG